MPIFKVQVSICASNESDKSPVTARERAVLLNRWVDAKLVQSPPDANGMSWSWTIWEATIIGLHTIGGFEVVAKCRELTVVILMASVTDSAIINRGCKGQLATSGYCLESEGFGRECMECDEVCDSVDEKEWRSFLSRK